MLQQGMNENAHKNFTMCMIVRNGEASSRRERNQAGRQHSMSWDLLVDVRPPHEGLSTHLARGESRRSSPTV